MTDGRWEDLEVTKRSLNLGTAGILPHPDFDIPPNSTGTAVIAWKTSGKNDKLLKDRTLEETIVLTVTKVTIDPKSIDVPPEQPKLPLGEKKKSGRVSTAGQAIDEVLGQAVKDAAESGAEIPPHRFEPGDTAEGAEPACRWCGLASSSGVHAEALPRPHPFVAGEGDGCENCGRPALDGVHTRPKRSRSSGGMKATRRPRARG